MAILISVDGQSNYLWDMGKKIVITVYQLCGEMHPVMTATAVITADVCAS